MHIITEGSGVEHCSGGGGGEGAHLLILSLISLAESDTKMAEEEMLALILPSSPCSAGKNCDSISAGFLKPRVSACSLVSRKYGSCTAQANSHIELTAKLLEATLNSQQIHVQSWKPIERDAKGHRILLMLVSALSSLGHLHAHVYTAMH